jgi:hypothetical protein
MTDFPKISCRLLVGVKSCQGNALRRMAISRTWLSGQVPEGIYVVFFMGGDAPAFDGRVVTLAAPDGYRELPQKVRAFLSWALKQVDFGHVMVVDDDSYVRLSVLAQPLPALDYFGTNPVDGYCSGGGGMFLSRAAAEDVAARMVEHEGADDQLVGKHCKEAAVRYGIVDFGQPPAVVMQADIPYLMRAVHEGRINGKWAR